MASCAREPGGIPAGADCVPRGLGDGQRVCNGRHCGKGLCDGRRDGSGGDGHGGQAKARSPVRWPLPWGC
eukprot:6522611-Alexandrium_andersonii.AAC.1